MIDSRAGARLIVIEPDLGRFLSAEEQAAAREVAVPVVRIDKGPVDVSAFLERLDAVGLMLLDGMLMHRLRIGEPVTARLQGPGDILALPGLSPSMLLAESSYRATERTRVALLGSEVLSAVRRWPGLAAGIQVRLAEQAERLCAQLAISQLPRVEQRVLSLLWLLAESWGRVSRAGTSLPLSLTHDTLGALVGARRPTVTLALGELSARGAIVRQHEGWLLLESPPRPTAQAPALDEPRVIPDSGPSWAAADVQPVSSGYEQLRTTVEVLRADYLRNRERVKTQLAELARAREQVRVRQVREEIIGQRLRSRAPS